MGAVAEVVTNAACGEGRAAVGFAGFGGFAPFGEFAEDAAGFGVLGAFVPFAGFPAEFVVGLPSDEFDGAGALAGAASGSVLAAGGSCSAATGTVTKTSSAGDEVAIARRSPTFRGMPAGHR